VTKTNQDSFMKPEIEHIQRTTSTYGEPAKKEMNPQRKRADRKKEEKERRRKKEGTKDKTSTRQDEHTSDDTQDIPQCHATGLKYSPPIKYPRSGVAKQTRTAQNFEKPVSK
jgi:hypothetical protein